MTNKTVLFAAADDDFRRMLSERCESIGLEIQHARNLPSVSKVAAKRVPDTIGVNLQIPTGNGLTFCELLASTPANENVPVIVLTGQSGLQIQRKTEQLSTYFVEKGGDSWPTREPWIRQLTAKTHARNAESRWAHEEAVRRMVAAAARHGKETDAHVQRTGVLSEALALEAGWLPAEASRLGMAAPMHDVGNIGISDAILHKGGTLTFDEFEILKQHTTIGARMLAHSSSPVMQLAKKIALSHHERWDGTGYPQRLAGDAIPEAARILTIVDVYDVLSHAHVNRPALSEDAVLATMRQGQGTHFDPGFAGLFLARFEEMHRIAEAHPDATSDQ